jgi:hypothetical protein
MKLRIFIHDRLNAVIRPLDGRFGLDHGCGPPSAPRASPSARRRSRRRTTGGGRRNGLPASGGGKMATQSRRLRPIRQLSRAVGVQAHRCVVGGVPVKWPRAQLLDSRRISNWRRPPAGPAQTTDASAFRAARIPIRTRAVAATDSGRRVRELAAGHQAARSPRGWLCVARPPVRIGSRPD